MKNWIKSMFVVLCGMMIATTFVACGDDDDDNGGGDSSSIVGTWVGSESSSVTQNITFNSNKTGEFWVVENDHIDTSFTFTWVKSGNVINITPTGGEIEDVKFTTLTIESISSTTALVTIGKKTYTWTKVI